MQTIIITALVTAILCTISFVSWGQTFSEWFRQKKTKIKYLRKQIAALEAFKAIVEAGYGQAEKGVDTTEAIEEVTFKMDEEWLVRLGMVKPVFRESEDVRESYSIAKSLIRESEEVLTIVATNPWLKTGERKQLQSDLNLLISDMGQTLTDLLLFITDGSVTMEDKDRWKRIVDIRDHVTAGAQFQLMILTNAQTLIEARQQQEANDRYLKMSLQ